jgi:hypothetical protein
MIVTFSMDAFSAVAGHATSPAWHTSMPSGGGIHPIKAQSPLRERPLRADRCRPAPTQWTAATRQYRSLAGNFPNGKIADGRVLDDDELVLISDAEIDSGLHPLMALPETAGV